MSRTRLIFIGMLAVCGISGASAASASALHWYNGAGEKLPEGIALRVQVAGGEVTLKGTITGIKFEVTCSTISGEGYVVNPAGGAQGLALLLLLYTGCKVVKPAGSGCVVRNEDIHVHAHVWMDLFMNGKDDAEFIGGAGGGEAPLFEVTLEGCTNTALNNTFPAGGFAWGIVNPENASIEFRNEEPNTFLKFAGKAATLTGKETMEMEGGGALKVGE